MTELVERFWSNAPCSEKKNSVYFVQNKAFEKTFLEGICPFYAEYNYIVSLYSDYIEFINIINENEPITDNN